MPSSLRLAISRKALPLYLPGTAGAGAGPDVIGFAGVLDGPDGFGAGVGVCPESGACVGGDVEGVGVVVVSLGACVGAGVDCVGAGAFVDTSCGASPPPEQPAKSKTINARGKYVFMAPLV